MNEFRLSIHFTFTHTHTFILCSWKFFPTCGFCGAVASDNWHVSLPTFRFRKRAILRHVALNHKVDGRLGVVTVSADRRVFATRCAADINPYSDVRCGAGDSFGAAPSLLAIGTSLFGAL